MSIETFTKYEHHAATVGDRLRIARESLGLTIRDMAEITRIQAIWLECIEADRYDEMPAEVFIRGFLRSYARELRLDEDAIFDAYVAQTGQFRNVLPAISDDKSRADHHLMSRLGRRSSTSTYLYGAAIAALIALLAGVLLTVSTSQQSETAANSFRMNDTTDAWQPMLDNASDWRRQ